MPASPAIKHHAAVRGGRLAPPFVQVRQFFAPADERATDDRSDDHASYSRAERRRTCAPTGVAHFARRIFSLSRA